MTTERNPAHDPRRVSEYLLLAVRGCCMGAADIVPGVSGGTMAFLLGIYEKLVASIRSFDLAFLRLLFSGRIRDALGHVSWRFLLPLASGILLAALSLVHLLGWLLDTHPIPVWSFFFGLILASAVAVGGRLSRWTPAALIWALAGAAGTFLVVGLVPLETPETPLFVFASGAVAICAMILPGISGAFILVLLGKYEYVLEAVTHRDLPVVALVAAGAATGIIAFSRLLNWLLERHHDTVVAFLTGLMYGSLRRIWPFKAAVTGGAAGAPAANVLPPLDTGTAVALLLAAAGVALVLGINAAAHRGASVR